jgi:hypothetical protein
MVVPHPRQRDTECGEGADGASNAKQYFSVNNNAQSRISKNQNAQIILEPL